MTGHSPLFSHLSLRQPQLIRGCTAVGTLFQTKYPPPLLTLPHSAVLQGSTCNELQQTHLRPRRRQAGPHYHLLSLIVIAPPLFAHPTPIPNTQGQYTQHYQPRLLFYTESEASMIRMCFEPGIQGIAAWKCMIRRAFPEDDILVNLSAKKQPYSPLI